LIVALMCWRIQKMPKALTRPGTMRACRVSTQPSLEMMRYCGMTPSWAGTVIVSTSSRNRTSRPLKVIFANAKPAREHRNACPIPMHAATTKLFSRERRNGMVSKTSFRRLRKLPPGITRGGICEAACEPTEDTTNIQ
jgi:hypothetical protein